MFRACAYLCPFILCASVPKCVYFRRFHQLLNLKNINAWFRVRLVHLNKIPFTLSPHGPLLNLRIKLLRKGNESGGSRVKGVTGDGRQSSDKRPQTGRLHQARVWRKRGE